MFRLASTILIAVILISTASSCSSQEEEKPSLLTEDEIQTIANDDLDAIADHLFSLVASENAETYLWSVLGNSSWDVSVVTNDGRKIIILEDDQIVAGIKRNEVENTKYHLVVLFVEETGVVGEWQIYSNGLLVTTNSNLENEIKE